MPNTVAKVILRPDIHSNDLFQVVVNPEEYKKWKAGDTTIPLADVVDSFQIFHTNQGAQGVLGKASKQLLENHFDSSKDVDVVTQILQRGEMQLATGADRGGVYASTNDAKMGGNQVSHGAHSGGR